MSGWLLSEKRRMVSLLQNAPRSLRRAVWIAVALIAGLAAALVQPEVASEGQVADDWLWCLGAAAGSVAAAIVPLRLLRLR